MSRHPIENGRGLVTVDGDYTTVEFYGPRGTTTFRYTRVDTGAGHTVQAVDDPEGPVEPGMLGAARQYAVRFTQGALKRNRKTRRAA